MNRLLFFLLFTCFLIGGNTYGQTTYKQALAQAYYCETDSCFQEALDKAQVFLTTDTAIAFQDYIRFFYFIKTKQLDSADYYYPKAISFDLKTKNWPIYFSTINARINSLRDRVLYEQAVAEVKEAIDLASKNNLPIEQALLHKDLGLIYHEMGLFADGIRQAKIAQSMLRNQPDKLTEYMAAVNTIAINFDDWNKPDSALYYHYININLGFDNVPERTAASTYNNIGNTYLKQKQLDSALVYFNKALAIAQSSENANSLATVYNNLGDIYLQKNEIGQAKTALDSALHYAEQAEYARIEKQRDVYNTLSRYHQKVGNMTEAFEFQSLFVTFRDSLRNMEQIQQIKKLELQAQTAQKDKEIAKSKLDIKNRNQWIMLISIVVVLLIVWVRQLQIKRQQAAREAMYKVQEERLRISRDLHDNIGAELSYMTSIIDQKSYNLTDPDRKKEYEVLSDSSRRAMSQLRETIWAIKTKDITIEKFGEKLQEFKTQYASLPNLNIDIDVEKSQKLLSPTRVIHLFRVCQEALNNAIKHSKCTHISIALKLENQTIKMAIKDNGVGFDSNSIVMGYGLQNMEERINEINGDFLLDSSIDKGTTILVKLPLS